MITTIDHEIVYTCVLNVLIKKHGLQKQTRLTGLWLVGSLFPPRIILKAFLYYKSSDNLSQSCIIKWSIFSGITLKFHQNYESSYLIFQTFSGVGMGMTPETSHFFAFWCFTRQP